MKSFAETQNLRSYHIENNLKKNRRIRRSFGSYQKSDRHIFWHGTTLTVLRITLFYIYSAQT